jgi:hypothetical protein
VRERDLASPSSAPNASDAVEAPLSDEERERRLGRYRDYLETEGLTPLGEATP